MKLNYLFNYKKIDYTLKFAFAVFIFLSFQTNLKAQEKSFDKTINAFQDYSTAYREVAYCHLNKSTYIKGEMLGFSSYVFNKDLKKPSTLTKNLYCIITDSTNKVIKSKLVKVKDGFANNIFTIDSLFTSGNYTFKAYTNWMRNFDEHNTFVETFKIIDPEVETKVIGKVVENSIDAQFLPEGGYFVNAVKTNVGVVIKNVEGFGVSNAEGVILDNNKQIITTFKTNTLGIGRFLFTPVLNQQYTVEINYLNKEFTFIIDDIKPKGISISLNDLKGKLAVEFNTNNKTIKTIKGKPFKLVIHNGKVIKVIDVEINSKSVIKAINNEELFFGINIFTLFDENNTPVLERLFFNYEGIHFIHSEKPSLAKSKDSLTIKIPFNNLTPFNSKSNISVSILPNETKSYQRHHNIISYTFLQPYINGYIENAAYYFTEIDRKKKYDLDNLLITQGWSCYNWNNIFNNKPTNSFAFEDGISIKANRNSNNQNHFIIYPLENTEGFIVDLPENENSFFKSGFYPSEDETLSLGLLNSKGRMIKPNFYMQFYPSAIPDFNNYKPALKPKELSYTKYTAAIPFAINLDETQQLNEVVVKTDLRQTKIDMLKGSSFNRVYLFDDKIRAMNLSLANYISTYIPGYSAIDQGGNFIIRASNSNSKLGSPSSGPIVYLNDMRLSSYEFLINFDMSTIDYIAVNRHGLGEGMRGGYSGAIRIYTSNTFSSKKQKTSFREYSFPLAFSKDKKFYAPKYNTYTDAFFKEYGVIDWIPNCTIDDKGNLNFTIYNPYNNNLKLFIEGVTDDGKFLSETKTIILNKS